ncbi:MAG: 2-C-methyl-D-erythritol 4-phosphate cytidylyltransferase [Clostridiales bacterium]|nr:2-C-methyl-D-erythritol 4-phosphate cytidylyltransferase [Clostridiales bacterium]
MTEQHPFIQIFTRRRGTEPSPPEEDRPRTAAVVVAAGASSRMGGVPKQLLPLGGMPVLARSLLALDRASLVDEIVVVAREEEMIPFYDICRHYEIGKASLIIRGGATRQQSVIIGASQVREGTDYLAIHDGARPLVRSERVDEVIREACRWKAAAVAVPVKDTVKMADEEGFISATPDRRLLWNVQTPQVFERDLYLEALHTAEREGKDYTDDCQLVERLGTQVKLVHGDYDNIKITTPEDIPMAEGLLKSAALAEEPGAGL